MTIPETKSCKYNQDFYFRLGIKQIIMKKVALRLCLTFLTFSPLFAFLLKVIIHKLRLSFKIVLDICQYALWLQRVAATKVHAGLRR